MSIGFNTIHKYNNISTCLKVTKHEKIKTRLTSSHRQCSKRSK